MMNNWLLMKKYFKSYFGQANISYSCYDLWMLIILIMNLHLKKNHVTFQSDFKNFWSCIETFHEDCIVKCCGPLVLILFKEKNKVSWGELISERFTLRTSPLIDWFHKQLLQKPTSYPWKVKKTHVWTFVVCINQN